MYISLYSHYKSIGYCEGASKQFQDLKNYTAPEPRPPVYKFQDPPLQDLSLRKQNMFFIEMESENVYL